MKVPKCKRCIIAALLLVLILSSVAVIAFAQDASSEGEETMNANITDATFSSVIMNIGADETKRNITWYSNYQTSGEVRYAKVSDMKGDAFPATYMSSTAKVAKTTKLGYYSYKAIMTNLEENTSYVYCLVTGATVSENYFFDTKSFSDEYTFVFAGDPQVGTTGAASWSDTLAKIDEHFSESSFIVSAGDQTSTPTNETDYDNFIVDGLSKIAVGITLGTTHDNATPFIEHYNLPNLSSTYGVSAISSDYYYTYNSTLFIHLNVESADYVSHAEFVRRTTAANPDTRWQVVVIHYPPYSGGSYSSNAPFRENLTSVYTECGIDIVLSGHDHMYARSKMIIDTNTLSSDIITDNSVTDPEGVLYLCAAPSTTTAGFRTSAYETSEYTLVQDKTARKSIVVFNMTETSMTLTSYYIDKDEPEQFDTFTINHTTDGGEGSEELPANTYHVTYVTDLGYTFGDDISAYTTERVAAGDQPDVPTLYDAKGSFEEGVLYEYSWKFISSESGEETDAFEVGKSYIAYVTRNAKSVSDTLYIAGKTNSEAGVYTWSDAWVIVLAFPQKEFRLVLNEDIKLTETDAVVVKAPVFVTIDLCGNKLDTTAVDNLISLSTGADTSKISLVTSKRGGALYSKSFVYLNSSARTTLNINFGSKDTYPLYVKTSAILLNAGNNFKNDSHLYLNIEGGRYDLASSLLYIHNYKDNHNNYYVTVNNAQITSGSSVLSFKSGIFARNTSTFEATNSEFVTSATAPKTFFSLNNWYGGASFTSCHFNGIVFDDATTSLPKGIVFNDGCTFKNSDASFNGDKSAFASSKSQMPSGSELYVNGEGKVAVINKDNDILETLDTIHQGELYEGIQIPEGAAGIYSEDAPEGPGTTNVGYVDSGRGDGSKAFVDTKNDISAENGATTNITFRYLNYQYFTQSGKHMRYAVMSLNMAVGEAARDFSIRLRPYSKLIEVTYDADGNEIARKTVEAENRKEFYLLKYEHLTKSICINAGMYDASDNSDNLVIGSFNTELLTNFTIVIDSEENKVYYYVGGVYAGEKSNFLPGTKTEIDENGNTVVTYREWLRYDLSSYYGYFPFAGRQGTYGAVRSYFVNDMSLVFDENGAFVGQNKNVANGVFKIGDYYYYFENGIALTGTRVKLGNYILDLEEGTGRITSYSTKDFFHSMTDEEIKNASTDGKITNGEGSLSADAGLKEYTVPVYNENGEIEGYTTTTLIKFTKENGYSSLHSLSLGSDLVYLKEDGTLGKGVTNASVTFNPAGTLNLNYDCVINFKVQLGKGVFTLKTNDGTPISDVDAGINLFRFRMGTGSTKGTDHSIGVIKVIDGKAYLFFGDVNCGELSTDKETDFSFVLDWNDPDTNTICNVKIYINGELKYTWKYEFGTANPANRFRLSQYFIGWTFTDTLYTFSPLRIYKTADGKNPEAITDFYTGYANNGTGVIYYENGEIVARGDIADVEATVGKLFAEIKGHNVALDTGSIHLNFYLKLATLASQEGAYALVSVRDKTEKVSLSDLVLQSNGYYRITAKLSSIEMGENVKVELFDKDGNKVEIYKGSSLRPYPDTVFSVQKYAEALIENADVYGETVTDLVKAMLLYGATAERYFEGEKGLPTASALSNTERLAITYGTVGTIYEDLAVSGSGFKYTLVDESASVDLTGTVSDVSKVGSIQLVLDYNLKIRIKLKTNTAPESILGGTLYYDGTDYYVDIGGLTAAELNTPQTVVVDGTTIRISALAIANTVVASESYSEEFKNLMKALYQYYYYTDLFVKAMGGK